MDLWSGMIRRYRLQRGLTQAAFAEIAGVEQATVSRWERGGHRPDIAMQRKLRDLIGQPDRFSDRLILHRTEVALWPMCLRRESGELVAASASARAFLARLPARPSDDRRPAEDAVLRQWAFAVGARFFGGEIASIQGAGTWYPAAGGPACCGTWVWSPVTAADGEILLSSQFQADDRQPCTEALAESCEITSIDDLIFR